MTTRARSVLEKTGVQWAHSSIFCPWRRSCSVKKLVAPVSRGHQYCGRSAREEILIQSDLVQEQTGIR